MVDFLIVGSGLYGSTFARNAAENGYSSIIVEKRSHIGGNCYTKKVDNIDVHIYGPHIFHTSNQKIWNWVNRFSEFNQFQYSPVARYQNENYSLPFNMWTFNQMWGLTDPELVKSKIQEQSNITNPSNLEEQAISMVGEDIYLKLIKGYTTKQWGTDPSNLPKSIIKRLPLRFEWNSNYFNDKFQGIPTDGYTKMFENILDHHRISVRLDVDYLENKTKLDKLAKVVVYTGPIDRYYDYCYGNLDYRSLSWKSTKHDTNNYQGCPVVNYTDSDVPYTRIIEHKWFNNRNQKKTIVSKEYPEKYSVGKEPFYPCYDSESLSRYQAYKKLSESEDSTIFGGRLAEYKYYDMHQVIASALTRSDQYIKQLSHDK